MTSKSLDTASTSIAAAQHEMRHAYLGGAPGMLVSALAWLVAGLVALRVSPERAVWALFIGGMLIHPVSLLLLKLLGRPAKHSPGNPFGTLALASTFWMLLCLPLAYGVSLLRLEWFFPAMLFVIGGRYLTFSTMFGMRLYWACGAVLAGAGYALAKMQAAPALGAFSGAAIEALFALALFAGMRREALVEVA
ncbi:MAG: hypothetical protein HYV16_16795 [Gammaproteobacteria bacterium]|nr:hypothetical protein [Gammaproteobacteria bacterium]